MFQLKYQLQNTIYDWLLKNVEYNLVRNLQNSYSCFPFDSIRDVLRWENGVEIMIII